MPLAVDSEMASNVGAGAAGNPITSPNTFSFTNTSGTVLYLAVGIGASGGTVSTTFGAVTYGGVAMTSIVERSPSGTSNGGRLGIFRLLNPPTGSNTVSIAWTSSGSPFEWFAGCISFTGNDATTPEAQSGSGQGSSATASLALTGVVAGNISVVVAGAGSSMSAQTQTLSWAKNVDDFSAMGNGRCSRSASSGSVTHSFTISSSDSWATCGVEVAASGGGGGGTVYPGLFNEIATVIPSETFAIQRAMKALYRRALRQSLKHAFA